MSEMLSLDLVQQVFQHEFEADEEACHDLAHLNVVVGQEGQQHPAATTD